MSPPAPRSEKRRKKKVLEVSSLSSLPPFLSLSRTHVPSRPLACPSLSPFPPQSPVAQFRKSMPCSQILRLNRTGQPDLAAPGPPQTQAPPTTHTHHPPSTSEPPSTVPDSPILRRVFLNFLKLLTIRLVWFFSRWASSNTMSSHLYSCWLWIPVPSSRSV